MDHLPKGRFTVKECVYSPFQGFTVTAPKVTKSTRTITHTKANNPKINTYYIYKEGVPEDILYAQVKFGQIKGLERDSTKKFGIGGTWSDNPNEEKRWIYTGTAGKALTINSRYLLPGSRILLARYDDNVTSVTVTLTYHKEKPEKSSCGESNQFYTETVGTDWMEISKAADDTPEGEIYYYYTILDKNDDPITDYSVIKNGVPVSGSDVTDREGVAVRMKAGDTVRLEGLQPGSYKIMETIDADEPEAFQMVVEETESISGSYGSVEVNILGSRTVTIKKAADASGEELPDLLYRYVITGGKDNSTEIELEIKAGGEAKVDLPEGRYTVTELDRSEIFELSYTDSGTVGVMTTTKAWSSRSFLSRAGERIQIHRP